MFADLLAAAVARTADELDEDLVALELAARELDARRLAIRAAAELKQTPALDGHRSMKAYLRARCNQSSFTALTEVRRARFCRDFPQVGDALMSGRIGLSQIDELVRIARNERAAKHLDHEQVDMLLEHAEHLPIRDLAVVVDRWLLHADPDGAWRDQSESVDARAAHVVAGNGEVHVNAVGGDAVTAETLTKIFGEFVEREFRKDCESRRAEHGDRADEFPLPRTDAQRRFDALVVIFTRAYAATDDGKMPDPVVNILCDQRTLHDLLGRAGLVLANGERLDLDLLQRQQIEAVLAEFVSDPSSILTRRCETSSGQPVPPRLLIQALLTAQVRRVVLNSRSTVIDFGERKRLFTGNARIAATLLERFCSHPGCEVSADRSQMDHMQSHSEGGRTDQANAAPECGPHNRFKYDNRWRTRKADNGRTYSIKPDGTVVLFIGEQPPEFTKADDLERQREGIAHLEELRARLRRGAA